MNRQRFVNSCPDEAQNTSRSAMHGGKERYTHIYKHYHGTVETWLFSVAKRGEGVSSHVETNFRDVYYMPNSPSIYCITMKIVANISSIDLSLKIK